MPILEVINTVANYTNIAILTVFLATSVIFLKRLSFKKLDTAAKITLGLQILAPIMRLIYGIYSGGGNKIIFWYMIALPLTFIWLSLTFFLYEMQSIYLVLYEDDA